MVWPRSRSLFWTLSGAFFGVLVLAVLLQALVVVLVVEPVTRQWQRARAERIAEQVAERLAEESGLMRPERVERVLAETQRLVEGVRVFYVDAVGDILAAPPLPRGQRLRIGRLLRGETEPGFPRGAPRVRDQGDGPMTPAPRFGLEVLARAPVLAGGEDRGEIVVAQPRARLNILARVPERTLLFLPVALAVAGVAGLGVFLRLQRRLAALEELAARVGGGDLEARVVDPGRDEIGRLGQRLNAMTGRLAAAREELRAVDQQRRRLLGDIGHELATPLTTIRGYAETLLDPAVPLDAADRERYLAEVLHAAERMDRLIRDLLDLARLEAGALELEIESVDLASLARHAVQRSRNGFTRAGLELSFSGDDDGSAMVPADGLRLEQVLDNLLANALRHVPQGGSVRVEVRGRQEGVELSVRDDGPGFAEEDLPHVFDRFFRGDRSRSTTGTGLGLAIVREIVRRHGGEVVARNRARGGAEIRIEIPRSRSSHPGA